jgi:hypothetical protein
MVKTELSPFYNGFFLHYVQNMTNPALGSLAVPVLASARRSNCRIVRMAADNEDGTKLKF